MNRELSFIANFLQSTTKPIKFEVHYWGLFKLLSFRYSTDLPFAIAEKNSGYSKQILYFNPIKQYYHFKDQSDFPIAYSLTEFFGNMNTPKQSLYFDNRKKLSDLLTKEEFFITEINNPEYFEEAGAYLEIIDIFTKMALGLLNITSKSIIKDTSSLKEILVTTSTGSYFIKIKKELFDKEIINVLNKILVDENIYEYKFSSTINEDIKMVALKLNSEKFQLLNRMGLLI